MLKNMNSISDITSQVKGLVLRLICMLFCFMALPAGAQTGKLFNTDNHLTSDFACKVLQDKQGFIWVGTRNGLNRYDGYRFVTYQKATDENRGLTTNYINTLGQDKEGNLLLGTNNVLLRYNGVRFEKIPMLDKSGKECSTFINYIEPLRNGNSIVCTSGFGIMKITDGKVARQIVGGTKDLMYVYVAFEDKHGRLWFISENFKLFRMETNGKITSRMPGTEGLEIIDVKEDGSGNMYIATLKHGVYVMKHGSTVFTHIDVIPPHPIYCLFISRTGKVYMGCDGKGVSVYNPVTNQVIDNPFYCRQTDLSKAKVRNIMEDVQGNIWFSMLQKGVFMQPVETNDFGYQGYKNGEKNSIGEWCATYVMASRNRHLWIGTDKGGVYELDENMRQIRHYSQALATILTLCEDQKGNIWMGGYMEGCGYLDPAGNYHAVALPFKDKYSVFDIKADKYGNLWFATMGQGLVCRKPDGSMKNYRMKAGADSNPKMNAIPNDFVVKIALSKDHNRIYLATSVGLCCYDVRKDSWTSAFGVNILCKGSFSHAVFVDSKSRIWYGTEDGLHCYWMKNGTQHKLYTTENGLCDNGVVSIVEDAYGCIWIGTVHGLCRLNPQTGETGNFYLENGLQSNEFSDGAACAIDGGKTLLFGGTGGINKFTPIKGNRPKWDATVNLSSIMLGNKLVVADMKSGSYDITDKPVSLSDRFDFCHEDNTFILHFSTFTYNNVEQIEYAYSINGEEWIVMQPGMNEVGFSHLQPGSYKFRVKALCNGRETAEKTFTIVVHPAWWASWWAKCFYLLVLVALAVLYFRHRRQKEEDRLLLQKHIHAEEISEAKLRFFINISHDIRTPLTLIVAPLLSLMKEDKDPHRQGAYEIIRKNSERILHLINQMMDLRKIDKGQMVMRMSETNMVAFMQDVYELFKQQAMAKNINFTFKHDMESLPLWIDCNNFDKVLVNVLSNAFKFTPTGGKVTLSLTATQEHAYISVKDNGIGIPKDKLETIFQRFYQTSNKVNDKNVGTGIGLDLARSLVELHYGTIVARNNEQEPGCEFVIRLRLGNAHLKPEEMEEVRHEEEPVLTAVEDEVQEVQKQENIVGEDIRQGSNSDNKAEVVVVEDDDEILTYLKTQLSVDYNVRTYTNGKEALSGILKSQPAIIISDVSMPLMDGTTLCRKLKANVNTNSIPIILLTAMSRDEDMLEGLETGADAYITKPFNLDILRRKMINLLNVRRTLHYKFSGKESQEDKVDDVELLSPNDKLLERIMRVINDNLSDSDLSVDFIAQEVGVSRVHLHRKMKELTNQTPHSFIRNIRLKQAAKLLKESHQSITEVMYACGFSNPASFSTMFKSQYGCSPREYMNQT